MMIQEEIWMTAIVEDLFASSNFLSKAFNAGGYVSNGKTVHIPNAGVAPGTKGDQISLPATVTKRTDIDMTFPLSEYTTDPVLIPNADTMKLNYDKQKSVLCQDKLKLQDDVALDFVFNWSPAAAQYIETTGTKIDAYTNKVTGKREDICKADVLGLIIKFNNDDTLQERRYLLLDAQMCSQLLDSLVESESTAFLASADAQNSILGKLFNFNVVICSRVTLYTTAKASEVWSATDAATNLAVGLAWHKRSVCHALGEMKAFESGGNAAYYGDIYSFLVRAGGRIMHEDKKGVIALIQGTPIAGKSYGRIEMFSNPLHRHASGP